MAEFTKFEEENIILLALESPEFFYRISTFMKPTYFERPECQYLVNSLVEYYEKFQAIPTKELIENHIAKDLSADDEVTGPLLEVLNKKLDPRNSPFIRDLVITWAKKKQIAMLYDDEVMEKVKNNDFEDVFSIIDEASKIQDTIIKPFRFFKDIDRLFIVEERDYFTTCSKRLDAKFHGKGPARREVMLWVAPTGVGKSIMLVNTGVANLLNGKNVLHITLENSAELTGNRYIGAFTEFNIADRVKNKGAIKEACEKIKLTNDKELMILYFPADSISVDTIEVAIRDLEKHYGFVPDVLIVDYLELLMSKYPQRNKEDYTRQKSVSTELCALTAKINTFTASASQTNRAGSKDNTEGDAVINLDKLAESYGKAMPVDYVVSINQNSTEYQQQGMATSHIGRVRFFIAKNRNGPKFEVVNAQINYLNMKAKEDGTAAG